MKKGLLLLLLPLLLTGCSTNADTSSKQVDNQETTANKNSNVDKSSSDSTGNVTAKEISNWTYASGDKAVKILNNDRPTTIQANDFDQAHIDYGGLDNLNRTKTATAYLTRNNLGKSNTRTEQTWRPTGWHNEPKTINGTRVIPQNRGHLIAYTMTFNLNKSGQTQQGQLGSIDNPYNLFTQTEFSNQKTMTEIEQMVRNKLAQNKKIIYQVTPIFRGNELMARGVWVQALSTDGSLKINRYLWNVQNNIVFDYATGRSTVDRTFTVPGVANNYQNKHYNNRHKNYRHYKKYRHYYH
ncbi:DNA/RNA non-specific endonuclease [Companilactobacillus paralimentarius]|uniref:DNA/RNA non-specific endonuclease n=1 Tax=Companilactobacillus paralimentarius TaxID=83526 RepID=UPI00384C6ACF